MSHWLNSNIIIIKVRILVCDKVFIESRSLDLRLVTSTVNWYCRRVLAAKSVNKSLKPPPSKPTGSVLCIGASVPLER